MSPVTRFALVAIDTDIPEELARFYADVTGWQIEAHDDSRWIQLTSDSGATIAFQQVEDHNPPEWPGSAHPQQLHIDFEVDDLDAGENAVLALGARKADYQPGTSFRVYLDPSGHPFCLVQS